MGHRYSNSTRVTPLFKDGQGVDRSAERRRWERERPEVLRRWIRCLAGTVLEQRLQGHRCGQRVDEIHHRRRTGRGGQYRLPANHLPVCSACHRAVHANPELARDLGMLVMEGDPEWDLLGYAVDPPAPGQLLHPSQWPNDADAGNLPAPSTKVADVESRCTSCSWLILAGERVGLDDSGQWVHEECVG